MDGEKIFFLLIGITLAYGVGCLGRNRKIGFGWAFALSIFNIFLGLIITLCSKKKKNDIDFIDINRDNK
jgi:hypothetical protein